MFPRIIYSDKNFLAINKPAGLLVHPINRADNSITLVSWLLEKFPEIKNVGDAPEIRPGIVHRLDKDTSGVLLICRNREFFEYLKKLFQEHKVKKNYLALVEGELKSKKGIIEKSISIKSKTIKRTIHKGRNEKAAITEYEVVKIFERNGKKFSLLKISPQTGRTHQIRVHLASIGHPIVGDALYGRRENVFGLKRQFLHAESVEFTLPDGGRIKIEADLPEDLTEVAENPSTEHISSLCARCSVNGRTFSRTGGARSSPSKNTLIRRALST